MKNIGEWVIIAILAFYGGFVIKRMPTPTLLDNDLNQMLIIILIALASKKNMTIALVLSICWGLLLQQTNKYKLEQQLVALIDQGELTEQINREYPLVNEKTEHIDNSFGSDNYCSLLSDTELPNYVSSVANQMNELSNNGEFTMDEGNGLGWGSYGGGDYASF